MEKIRVLHVITGMGSGGAEAFIMNMFRNIDNKQVVFDFLLRSEENMYEDEIKALGGKIYITPSYPKKFISNYIQTKKILKEHPEYKILHIHGNAFIYITALLIAKSKQIPCRIMHSHSTDTGRPIYRIVHIINKLLFMDFLVTDRFACSNKTGKWMFGNRSFLKINNGIDVDKFIYNEAMRERIRKEYNIGENTVLVGHVGRFLKVKNHSYIVDIFNEYVKQNENSKLMLIGEGPELNTIKKKVENLEIENKVIFLSKINNVNEMMQAMDIFIFPSIYEGLGIVNIEAQTASLPCIISDRIPRESIITDLVEVKSIDLDPKEWAISIDKNLKSNTRRNMKKVIENSGYSSKMSAKTLEDFYKEHS